jgi:hypothetical protein
MPNHDSWINQQNKEEESIKPSKFENHMLSIRDERQRMIYPNCHPTYNERHEKIIEWIGWTLEKYKVNMKKTQQQNEQVIIDNIIDELKKKRYSYTQKEASSTKRWSFNVSIRGNTLDYVLFRIRELTDILI